MSKSNMKLNAATRLEATREEEQCVLTLKGSPESLARVKAFLGMLCFNGAIGHSGIFGLGWDGDGQEKLTIPELESVIQEHRDGYNACCSYGGDIEYMGDLGSFFCASFSKDEKGIAQQNLVWPERKEVVGNIEYRYAMVNRPIGIGTCPKDGLLRAEDRPPKGHDHHDMARHGVLVYTRELAPKETKDFELAPMIDGADRIALAKTIAHAMKAYAKGYLESYDGPADDRDMVVQSVYQKLKKLDTYQPSVGNIGDFAELVVKHLR